MAMQFFPLFEDTKVQVATSPFNYYIEVDGEVVYRGRAWKSPNDATIGINVRRIAQDYLENHKDILLDGVEKQEEAYREVYLYDASDDTLVAYYGVLFDSYAPWSGESKTLSQPVNGHMDPRMRIPYSRYNQTGTTIGMETEDIYFFDAQDTVSVAWDAGQAIVGISTNRWLNDIRAEVPSGVTVQSRDYSGFVFNVPVNWTDTAVTYTVNWYVKGESADTTVITVGAYSAYFTCPSAITISGDGTYFEIPFQTDIPLRYIEAIPGTGLRLVSLENGVARFWADPSESLSGFTTSVVFRNTMRNEEVGYTAVIVSAPEYYFIVDPLFTMNCDGGTLTIPINTVYDMQEVAVNLPSGVTLLSKTQTGITVSVVANTSTTDKAYHGITFQRGSILGRTTIEVGIFTYQFSTVPTVHYNPYDEENVFIPWSTNIPLEDIGVILPSGSTIVSKDASGVTVTHPTQDGTVTFTYKGSVLATVAVKSLAEEYFTCVALTQGYLPWTSEFEVRINKGEWQTLNASGGTLLEIGDVAELRGTVNSPLHNSADHLWPDVKDTSRQGLCEFDSYGNILSMIYGADYDEATGYTGNKAIAGALAYTKVKDASGVILPEFTAPYSSAQLFANSTVTVAPELPYVDTIADYAYSEMFNYCSGLTYAPAVKARVIGVAGCQMMFGDCSGITSAGIISATTVYSQGCLWMFFRCQSLETAPDMSSITTLVMGDGMTDGEMFLEMFYHCSGLTYAPSVLNPTELKDQCYCRMFADCPSLTTVPQIKGTTMDQECCAEMFEGCISLTDVSSVLVNKPTLAVRCFAGMFGGCTGITAGPSLGATTLAQECYASMFRNCSSLQNAPYLPARTAKSECYKGMFSGCTSLVYISCRLTPNYNIGSTQNWVSGVPSGGTFVKYPTVTTWTTGSDGIPTGWTVTN